MASKTSPISKQEWDKHKATIMELYCVRGYPLTQPKNTKDEHKCVYWIMKSEHGFSASKSQYESRLRLWGATKNLKQSEWVSLLLEHDRLELQQKEVRIVISGQVQTAEKIKKARHRYMKGGPVISSTNSLAQAVEPNRHSFIEVKEGGQWRRHPSDRAPGPNDARVSIDRTPQCNQELHEEAISSPGTRASPTTMTDSTALEIPAGNNDPGDIGPTNQETSRPRTHTSRSSSCLESRCLDLEGVGDHVPMDGQDPQAALALVLQGGSNLAGVRHSPSHPEVRGLSDRVTSLLSDTSMFWNSRHSKSFVQPSTVPGHALFNNLLYSVINGFAGLEATPRTWVLRLLRENFLHISKLLRSGPDSVAEPIVDNLFPAAIEAGDVQDVASLLQATRNNPAISIDLNKLVYRVSAGVYTPLGLAIKSGSSAIVRVMLEAGADPNRAFGNNGSATALRLATTLFSVDGDYPILDIVRMLLDYGAEIDTESISGAVNGAEKKNILVIKELVQRLPAGKHAICFSSLPPRSDTMSEGDMLVSPRYEHRALVEDMIRFVDKSGATSLVKDLVRNCLSTNCEKCILDNPKVISSMVLQAARTGNLELVVFLMQYTTSLHQALTGAVKSGNQELINLLLENGARADGPAVHVTINRYHTEPSTPLAEAIRQGDDQLVRTLADYGAWRRLDGRYHLEAAINAAAEVGSIQYLQPILDDISHVERPPYSALNKAIARGSTECALALLRAGTPTCGNRWTRTGSGDDSLSLALQMRNKDVVDVLLDCGVHFANSPQQDLGGLPEIRCTMEIAGQWGDTEIIDAIASMGADLDAGLHTTALAAAVASKDLPLVDHILDLGADPGAKAQEGCSPLGEAVKNKDYPMIDYLLLKGATPADTSAFLAATEYDRVALVKLSSAFKQNHPLGLKWLFGTELLAQAIRANDAVGVSFWLDMKVDPATMVHVGMLYRDDIRPSDHGLELVSPLGLAIQSTEAGNMQVVDLLLRAGAPANAIAAKYTESRAGRGEFWTLKTPLLLAIQTRNTQMVNLLLEKGADINRAARRGVFCTPLQEACKISSYDLVELLLQKGANVNSPAARRGGGTALQFAAQSGSLKIVELLFLNRADPHAPGSEFGFGGTAFELAAEYGRYHVLLSLWDKARGGFTTAILHSAQHRAGKQGYRGCVELIKHILHGASFGRLALKEV